MDKEKIGSFIRALRVEKHMKQQDLADAVFVSRQAVSLWERGKTIPDSSILCLLSEFFDVSVNVISQFIAVFYFKFICNSKQALTFVLASVEKQITYLL